MYEHFCNDKYTIPLNYDEYNILLQYYKLLSHVYFNNFDAYLNFYFKYFTALII
jgi:hypothetical protein